MIDTLRTERPRADGVRALAVGAIVLLTAVTPAAAQQQSNPATELQSYRIPGWSFTPSLALGATYDTNVALSTPSADLGFTEGDTFFNIVPGGQLEFLGKYTDFSASYRGFVRRYVDFEALNSYDQQASVGVKRLVSRRLTLSARDSFGDTPTTDDTEVNGVPFRRAGARTNTLGLTSDYRFTKYTSLSTRYDQNWVEFDRPDIFLTGGWIHGLRNEVSHRLSERLALGGEYTFRVASLDRGDRSFTFQDAGGVLHLSLGPHTSASAAGGFGLLHDRNLDVTRTGPYVRLGITQMLERATIGASFERQYVPSFGFGGSSNSQELRGFVMMPLRPGLYTQGSAAWRRMTPFETTVLQLDTIWIRSAVGYAAARWARVELLYTFTRQDSIVTGGEVNRHRIGVQFVVSQPMRIQ
jgi:hypothetical protein